MASSDPTSTSEKYARINLSRILLWVGVVLTVIFCLAPVFWQLLTSFKTNAAISAIPSIYLPNFNQLTFEHYLNLGLPFLRYILNSALVSFISTLACLAIGAPAAYTLARLKIPGETIILYTILIVSLFPYVLLFLGLPKLNIAIAVLIVI